MRASHPRGLLLADFPNTGIVCRDVDDEGGVLRVYWSALPRPPTRTRMGLSRGLERIWFRGAGSVTQRKAF